MTPGETLQASIWMDGLESEAQVERFKREAFEAMQHKAQAAGYGLTPLRWAELRPGDPRVPDVPMHIAVAGVLSKPNVRLLVGEADLVAVNINSNFLAELEPKDLERLRAVTRRAYEESWRRWLARKVVCGECPGLTDRQCDRAVLRHGSRPALGTRRIGVSNDDSGCRAEDGKCNYRNPSLL